MGRGWHHLRRRLEMQYCFDAVPLNQIRAYHIKGHKFYNAHHYNAPAVKLRAMQCAFINGSIYCIRNGRKTYGHSRGWRRQRLREMRYRFDAVQQLQPRRTQWAIASSKKAPFELPNRRRVTLINTRESERRPQHGSGGCQTCGPARSVLLSN